MYRKCNSIPIVSINDLSIHGNVLTLNVGYFRQSLNIEIISATDLFIKHQLLSLTRNQSINMKKLIIGLAIVTGIAGLGYLALTLMKSNTKKHSPEAIAKYNKDDFALKAEYCQPSKKGRQIFGKLVPYQEVWRTGANEATLFTTNKELSFGDKTLKAGTYSIFTIPTASEWTIIFNGQTGQWGTQYDESEDVLRVPVTSAKVDQVKESFTISFNDSEGSVNMILNWDNVSVKVPMRPKE